MPKELKELLAKIDAERVEAERRMEARRQAEYEKHVREGYYDD